MMDLKKLTQSALEEQQQGKTLRNLAKLQEGKKKQFIPLADLKVDEVYRALIREQTPQEWEQLTESIKKEGIRDALVAYEQGGQFVLVDGHHRLQVAQSLGIDTLPIQPMQFASADEARVWMLRNQLGRRNLNDAERIEIALKLTEFLGKMGEANRKQGKGLSANLHKGGPAQKVDRLQEASQLANVSRRNVAKYKKIYDSGDDDLRREVVTGKKSIHKAHTELTGKPSPQTAAKAKKDNIAQQKLEGIFQQMQAWKAGKLSDEQMWQALKKVLA